MKHQTHHPLIPVSSLGLGEAIGVEDSEVGEEESGFLGRVAAGKEIGFTVYPLVDIGDLPTLDLPRCQVIRNANNP